MQQPCAVTNIIPTIVYSLLDKNQKIHCHPSHCGFTAEQSNLRDLIYFLFPPLSTSTRLFSPPPYSLTRSSFRSPCSMIGIIIRQLGNSLSLTWDGVPYHSVSSSTLNSSYFIGTQHQISAHVSAGFLTDHDCSERG